MKRHNYTALCQQTQVYNRSKIRQKATVRRAVLDAVQALSHAAGKSTCLTLGLRVDISDGRSNIKHRTGTRFIFISVSMTMGMNKVLRIDKTGESDKPERQTSVAVDSERGSVTNTHISIGRM